MLLISRLYNIYYVHLFAGSVWSDARLGGRLPVPVVYQFCARTSWHTSLLSSNCSMSSVARGRNSRSSSGKCVPPTCTFRSPGQFVSRKTDDRRKRHAADSRSAIGVCRISGAPRELQRLTPAADLGQDQSIASCFASRIEGRRRRCSRGRVDFPLGEQSTRPPAADASPRC
jgi:hypothetical protein